MFASSPNLSGISSAEYEVFHGNDIYNQEIHLQYYLIHLWHYCVTKNCDAGARLPVLYPHIWMCMRTSTTNPFLLLFDGVPLQLKGQKAARRCLLFYKDIRFPAGGRRHIGSA